MSPRKILAIKLRSLGDTILMTAPLAELRRSYPSAQIHAAVTAPWASVLDRHPAVDHVWACERHPDKAARAKAIMRLAFKLRREQYDAVICFHASPSSAMAAFATGAKTRSIHFHGHHDRNRYSTVTVPGKGQLKPIIERDMDAVRALGLHVPAGRMPEVFILDRELRYAGELLAKLGPGPVLGLGLGASRPTKSWPLDRFAQLAVSWCKATGGSALAVVGPQEEWLVQGFLKSVETIAGDSPLRSRIGVESRLKIRELAAVQSKMAVFAGNDSGPKHLAVAVKTPTVTLFGPEHPFEWHPYPEAMHPYFFIENLDCRQDAAPGMPAWCGLETCIEKQHRCLRDIGVDAVLERCRQVAKAANA
jgi:heptosyltransferase-2